MHHIKSVNLSEKLCFGKQIEWMGNSCPPMLFCESFEIPHHVSQGVLNLGPSHLPFLRAQFISMCTHDISNP